MRPSKAAPYRSNVGSRIVRLAVAAAASSLLPLAALSAQQPQARTMAELRQGFDSPPAAARLRCYWWWLNGNTDQATITHDLEEMKAKGFGGALLVDANGSDQEGNRGVPAGPMFGTPAWVALYTHALREADRLGLEITLNITSGWNLGGPDVPPEQSSKLLTWTRTLVQGGSPVAVRLDAPAATNGFYRQIAVLAYPLHHGTAISTNPRLLRLRSAAVETGFSMPDSTWMLTPGATPSPPPSRLGEAGGQLGGRPSEAASAAASQPADTSMAEVRDVSAQVSADGTLHWDPPPGDWEVLRIGYTDSDARVSTSSGAWQGRAIDYLSRQAFDAYWDRNVQPLLVAAKPFHSLKTLTTDSWELGGTNWTETFAEEFRHRRGYDPIPWLPAVAGRMVGSEDQTLRFLTDLRRTVADLVVANHYDRFAERAAEHGLGVQAESGGPHGAPVDALETFRRSAVPQTEFWSQNPHRSHDEERFFVKEAASAVNIYGRHFVADEGETSVGRQWSESLATDLKPTFDMAVTEGLNRLVWHEFTSSPASTGLPGQEYFAGTHLNPKVTWWNAGGAFFAYLNRVQFMMQQGTPVNDVLYFYGDNVPNFVRLKADDPAHVLPGYDYDVTDEDALLHTIRLERHELVGPSGVRWRLLVLPASGRLSLAALQRIEQLVRGGATVAGKPPMSPPGIAAPSELARFHALVAQVWGGGCESASPHSYGQGKVFCTAEGRTALALMHVLPDFISSAGDANQNASSNSPLDYVHRRDRNVDIFFLRNGSSSQTRVDGIFRVDGKAPELWDPVAGQADDNPGYGNIPSYHVLPDGRVQVQLVLPPFGSQFVIFAGKGAASHDSGLTASSRLPLSTQGAWKVSFQPGRGASAQPVGFNELKSWSESPDPRIRYFSGTATYRAQVSAPPLSSNAKVWLSFSDIREIARVKVNGHDAGTVWAKPLTLRVDRWLHPGANGLEIEVTNLWPNRIIGDLQPDATQHITSTNITFYHQNSPLLPSGLIGPLSWVVER